MSKKIDATLLVIHWDKGDMEAKVLDKETMDWINTSPEPFPEDTKESFFFFWSNSYPTNFEDPTLTKSLEDRLKKPVYGWPEDEFVNLSVNRVDWWDQKLLHAPYYDDNEDYYFYGGVRGLIEWLKEIGEKFNITKDIEITGY